MINWSIEMLTERRVTVFVPAMCRDAMTATRGAVREMYMSVFPILKEE